MTRLILLFVLTCPLLAQSTTGASALRTRGPSLGMVMRSQEEKNFDLRSVKDFGAHGDTLMAGDGAITSGTTAFCSGSAKFVASDVGKSIGIDYSLVGGTAAYVNGTITARTSSTCVTISAAAAVTVTAATFWYSRYDDTIPINLALAWACSTGFEAKTLFFPDAIYRHSGVLTCSVGPNSQTLPTHGVTLYGAGAGPVFLNTGAGTGALLVTTNGNSGDPGTTPVTGSTFFETNVTVEGLHFFSANSGISPFALRLYNQNGLNVSKIMIEGQDTLTTGIDVVGSEDGHISGFGIRGTKYGINLREAPGVNATLLVPSAAGNSSLDIGRGFVHDCTGSLFGPSGYSGTYTTAGSGAGIKISSGESVRVANIHFNVCAKAIDLSESDEINTPLQGVGQGTIEIANNHFELAHDGSIVLGPRPYQGWISIHDNNDGEAPIPGITGTTIAASVATGVQTVTPAAIPTGLVAGKTYVIANADGTNSELIVPTAVTSSTFTADFTLAKTGPGITLTSPTFGVFLKTLPKLVLGTHAYEVFPANSISIERNTVYGQIIIDPTTERVDLIRNAMFSSSMIVNGSTNQFFHYGNCNIAGLDKCPPLLSETPTKWTNQAEWLSPSLVPGAIGLFTGNLNIPGDWWVGIQGVGASTFVGLRMGSVPKTAPGVWGDTSNNGIHVCGPTGCALDTWLSATPGQLTISKPINVNSGAMAFPVTSPTLAFNRNVNGVIADVTRQAWYVFPNISGTDAFCLSHTSGSDVPLGEPLCLDSGGHVRLQNALDGTEGGTGLTSPGATGNVLTSNGTGWTSAAPSGGSPNVSTATGTLPIANGGTNATTAAAARTNLGVDLAPAVTGVTLTLAKITTGGANGSITISSTGRVTAYTPPT